MKTQNPINSAESAVTLAEMMVATGVLGLLGLLFFQILTSGMVLYAKNTAVNAAHDEARQGINRLTRDIHAAISVPQLSKDASPYPNNVVTSVLSGGTPIMSAGVCFQTITLGPNYVWKDPGSADMIMIKDGYQKAQVGMSIIFPLFGVETDVTKVQASGTANHSNVWLKNGEQVALSRRTSPFGSSSSLYSICYYTYRIMYLVRGGSYIPDAQGPYTITTGTTITAGAERFALQNGSYVPSASGSYTITSLPDRTSAGQHYRYENGELHLYKQNYVSNAFVWEDQAVLARYISSPTPFYTPVNFAGTADSKFVGVKLSTSDPKSTNRGYLATSSLLDTQIDYRSRLADAP